MRTFDQDWLVVSTQLKNMLVKLDHFPRDQGEHSKTCLSCHILEELHPEVQHQWLFLVPLIGVIGDI